MNHLFVVGLGRSGTTALGQIFGAHSGIVMGMERFKFLWSPDQIHRLRPRLFTEDRFFDFEGHGFTNVTPETPKWATYYERARAKFPTATYAGDKITQPATIPALRSNFPKARFLFIVRDVSEVAHSWQSRATDPDDRGWPAERDARAAVEEWNRGLRTMLDERAAHPQKVLLLDYATFFGAQDATPLRDVLRSLRLPMEDRIRGVYRGARLAYEEKIENKTRTLAPEVEAYIADAADVELWEHYRGLAGAPPADARPAPPAPAVAVQSAAPVGSAPTPGSGGALPNLLVAGTQKAGTTWLHAQLAKHPDIFMSEVKEIGYFHQPGNAEDPQALAAYHAHFGPGATAAYRGESTPHYFWRRDNRGAFSPHGTHDAATFARKTLGPDVRILLSLRDPVSRAISGYFHNIAMGRITVEHSIFRCPPSMGIVDLGFYERHWTHWSDTFGAAHIHALLFDDLGVDPSAYLTSALDFLGLDADTAFFDSVDPAKLGERAWIKKQKETQSPISPQEIAALLSLYADDIDFVERTTGRDLAAWRNLELLVDQHCTVDQQR